MAGLSDLTTTKSTVTTTLPSWYNTAQQSLTDQAMNAVAPPIGQTAAQGVISNLAPGSQTNPFTTGRELLTQIGSGAANPWITTTDATGQPTVRGNPNTAMGGLFNAQTDYLNQILPNISAGPEAANIGSGNFGSLRGLTAVNKTRADALSDLFQKQNTLALQNQQTGVQAGSGLGTLGNQETQAGLNTGTFQLEAPTKGLVGQSNVINALKPGTTVQTVGTPSVIAQLGAAGSAGQGLISGLFGNSSAGVLDQISKLFSSGGVTPEIDYSVPGAGINAGTFANEDDPLGTFISGLNP